MMRTATSLQVNLDATIRQEPVGTRGHHVTVIDSFYSDLEAVQTLADQASYERGTSRLQNSPGERAHATGDVSGAYDAVYRLQEVDRFAGTRTLGEVLAAAPPAPDREPEEVAVFTRYYGSEPLRGAQRIPHTDVTMNALVYLNNEQDVAGGLGFFRHRGTGLDYVPIRTDVQLLGVLAELGYKRSGLRGEGYGRALQRVLFNEVFAAKHPGPIDGQNRFWECHHFVPMHTNRMLIFHGGLAHSPMYHPTDFARESRLIQTLGIPLTELES